jgi:ABC-type antimicrobial peptide transport system permease subunit
VDDVVVNRIGEPPAPYFYLPFARVAAGEATFLIRMSADGGPSAPSIRAALTAVDPVLAPRQIVSMAAYRRYASTSFETTAALAAGLGLVGLVLSMLGVYGVVATRTADRMREFGIRLALGAARRNIAGLVLREGGQVAAVAIAIGVPVTLFVSRALGAVMFGISPWDPGAIGTALTCVGGAMLLATLLPAWRATRANPTSILREN